MQTTTFYEPIFFFLHNLESHQLSPRRFLNYQKHMLCAGHSCSIAGKTAGSFPFSGTERKVYLRKNFFKIHL